jgi:TatA/E family protein of Tat protein translocase
MELAPPLAFLGLSDTEILVIMAAILIFFGGKRMPELARGLGKALREFRRATSDVEREFKRLMDEAESQTIAPLRDSMNIPAGTFPTTASVFGTDTALTSSPPTPAAPAAEAAASPPAQVPAPSPVPAPPPHVPPPSHRLQPDQNDAEFHSDI